MAKPVITCTCVICGGAFTTSDRWRDRKACNKKECRSEVNRRASFLRKGITVRPRVEPIRPIDRGFRTILQPQIAPYLATLAAATSTRTD